MNALGGEALGRQAGPGAIPAVIEENKASRDIDHGGHIKEPRHVGEQAGRVVLVDQGVQEHPDRADPELLLRHAQLSGHGWLVLLKPWRGYESE